MSSLPPPVPGQPQGWYQTQQQLPVPPTSNTPLILGVVACGGALLLLIGSFMPWVSVATIFGTISVNGMDGDGVITAGAAAVGLVLLILGTTMRQRTLLLLGALACGAGAAVAVYDIANVSREIIGADLDGGGMVRAEVGSGLYVCAIGGLVGLITGVVAMGTTTTGSVRPAPLVPPGAIG